MARVALNKKAFFINKQGTRITPTFDSAFDFHEGLAAVEVGDKVAYYAIYATFAAFASLAALVASAAMKRNICCFNCASTSSAIVTTSGSSISNSKCYWLLSD